MARYAVTMEILVYVDADDPDEAGEAAMQELMSEYRLDYTTEQLVKEGFIYNLKAEKLKL